MYAPPPDRHARPPWWVWPTRLALDAPAVAVAWQRFLADAHGVPVSVAASAVLGLVVWGVYLADRWLDAAPGRPPDPADRHQFARRYRRGFGAAAVSAFVMAGGLAAVALPGGYLTAGAGVAGGVGLYLAATHLGRFPVGGKELAVGMLFAAGVAVPLVAELRAGAVVWLPAVAAFAALCWLNCGLIECWESGRGWALWLPAVAAVCLGIVAGPPVAGVVGASVMMLVGLDAINNRSDPAAQRALADAALLTPLIFGAWP